LVAARWQQRPQRLRRSSLGRMLEEAALKPHRSVDGLHSHAPDCEAKAQTICALSLQARRFSHEGRRVLCAAEKPGLQRRQRCFPTPPGPPGKPENREYAYSRHGVRA